jgi:hypothetical protein
VSNSKKTYFIHPFSFNRQLLLNATLDAQSQVDKAMLQQELANVQLPRSNDEPEWIRNGSPQLAPPDWPLQLSPFSSDEFIHSDRYTQQMPGILEGTFTIYRRWQERYPKNLNSGSAVSTKDGQYMRLLTHDTFCC